MWMCTLGRVTGRCYALKDMLDRHSKEGKQRQWEKVAKVLKENRPTSEIGEALYHRWQPPTS